MTAEMTIYSKAAVCLKSFFIPNMLQVRSDVVIAK